MRQILFWFKKVKLINLNQQKFSKSKSVDTTNIKFIANDKININIFLSYAAPKINIIKIIFTNGYLEMRDGKINKFFQEMYLIARVSSKYQNQKI